MLNLPLMADAFIAQQQLELVAALAKFDCGLPKNNTLQLQPKREAMDYRDKAGAAAGAQKPDWPEGRSR